MQVTGYMQQLDSRCECHDCTQARWKMSMQGQLSAQLGAKLEANPFQDAYEKAAVYNAPPRV